MPSRGRRGRHSCRRDGRRAGRRGSTERACHRQHHGGVLCVRTPSQGSASSTGPLSTPTSTGGGIGFPPAVEIFHAKVCMPTASSSAHRGRLLHRRYVLRFTTPPSWLSRTHWYCVLLLDLDGVGARCSRRRIGRSDASADCC